MKVLYISHDGITDHIGKSQVAPYLLGLAAKGYGITVLSKNVFKKYLFPKKMDLQKINQKLIKNNELSFQIIKKKFYEIGSKKGIALTKKYFKKM